jgi:Fe-S-cluster-containing hydrogenase component 2
MNTNLHPTARLVRQRPQPAARAPDTSALRTLALSAGADDVGFVDIDRPEVDDQRPEILALLPGARTLIAFVVKMNRDDIRAVARSVANVEFHHAVDDVNDIARRIARALGELGFRAVNPAAGFPMEMDRFPGKTWVVSHKPIAVAAGLGAMGIHRNVIHPRFGNFVLLGTVVTDVPLSDQMQPLDFNPCLECKLCVAACPVGAISPDGRFDFSACYTHNYREFMGGFTDWVEQVAEAKSAEDYRQRVPDAESASIWQSLSFGASYKAAYCLAVCPAGEEVISPFLESRKDFVANVLRPLQAKVEPVYVVKGSDAEQHVLERFPHKRVRRVGNGLRVRSIDALIRGMPLSFQRGRAAGLAARYHFSFRGSESAEITVDIREQELVVRRGLHDAADLHVIADTDTWLGVLAKERGIFWALVTRRIRLRGPVRLLRQFGRCFGE